MALFERPEDFEAAFRAAVAAVMPATKVSRVSRTIIAVKLRVELSGSSFIDVFFNARNQRTDLSLLRNEARIFGYDNLGGWHRHPASAPERHESCDEPELEAFLREVVAITS